MTLQEKIQKKAEGFGKLAPVFLEGAEFVLENLIEDKMSCNKIDKDTIEWINFEEEKPITGEEVLAFNKKWIDEDFNPRGIRVGFLGFDGFISAFWYDEQDCYETISKLHCESNKDFYKNHIDNTEPEFWFPFPKPPKK